MATIFRRKGIRILLICAAALIAVAVALPLLVPADRVRDLIVSRIEESTGADVEFGSASVRLFPRLRVRVGDGLINGPGERAAAAALPPQLESYRLSLASLDVDLALMPLLRKRIEMGKIRLVEPRLELVTRPAPPPATGATPPVGPGAGDAGSGATAPADAPALAWGLAIAGVEVRDGEVRWRESGSERSVLVAGWQQDITADDMATFLDRLVAFQNGGAPSAAVPGDVSLALAAELGRLELVGMRPGAPVVVEGLGLAGTLVLPSSADRLVIAVDGLTWRDVRLTAALSLTPPTVDAPRLAGECRLEPLALERLAEDLRGAVHEPSGGVGDWLASRPFAAGSLELTAALDLPWPLPPERDPRTLLAEAVTARGTLAGARVALPHELGEVTAAAQAELRGGRLVLSDVALATADGTLSVTGGIEAALPGAAGPLQGRLEGQADLARLAEIGRALAALKAPPDAAAAGPPVLLRGALALEAVVDWPRPPALDDSLAWKQVLAEKAWRGVTVTARATGLEATGGSLKTPLTVASAQATSDLRTATFEARGVTHAAFDGTVTGTATRLLPAPRLELDLGVGTLDVDRLVEEFGRPVEQALIPQPRTPLEALLGEIVGVVLAAAPATAPRTPPGELLPADLEAVFKARAGTVIMQKARYTDVGLEGALAGRVFDFSRVAGKRSTGEITASGRLDYAADPYGELTFAAQARAVPASALLEPYVPKLAPLWQGALDAEVGGGCRVEDKTSVLASLALSGDALSTNGSIDASSWLAGVSSYLGQRQDLKVIRFKEFLHHLEVRDGSYHLKDLQVHGLDTDWWGDGWIALDGQTSELSLNVKLPKGFQPDLGNLSFLAESLRDEDGRIALGMKLSGPIGHPQVEVDLSEAKAKAGDTVKDAVKDGVQGLLDKWKRK